MIDRPITVLVIDDSAANRRELSRMLEDAPGIRVVDRAGDGEEGLKKAIALKPDLITLDLEMPRLDGYTFLRLLMARAPTPVIVVSSYAHPSDVFKALQLGAFDFVARPSAGESLASLRAELIEKVRAVRFVRRDEPVPVAAGTARRARAAEPERTVVVGIGASTGGPPAVQKLLESLEGLPVCVLVAQHMPARFTDAFAERLDQALAFRVREARSGERLLPGCVYVAPGGEHLEVAVRGEEQVVVVKPNLPGDTYAPSIDRLFRSMALVLGAEAVGVVLTGMGTDGALGVQALAAVGARCWAEAESSAVVFGMPEAAIKTGAVRHVLALDALGSHLARALTRKSE
jgi:two-component system, chemotaxis family, protein-glutamate methylesterase/glutaminase